MNSFLLAEKFIPAEQLAKVAEVILRAQDIREESWNNGTYNKTDHQSAAEAVNEVFKDADVGFWTEVIGNWLCFAWNDSGYWAEAVIKSRFSDEAYVKADTSDEFETLIKGMGFTDPAHFTEVTGVEEIDMMGKEFQLAHNRVYFRE